MSVLVVRTAGWVRIYDGWTRLTAASLDPLGNWTTYQFDGDGDGNFTSGADLNDARSYDSPAGLANEITEWDPWPADSQNNPVAPVYDRAGNMTDDNYQYVYTYDAWNRLVKVEDQGMTPAVVGAHGYDGLNRRITRTIGSDNPIHEYYTESWQRIESRPGGEGSTTGVSLFVFGTRYIDDIVMRQRDANASGPPEERRYYLTDANYNVAMLVTDSGWGVERVFYTAYGEPEVFPFGDADGDYGVDTADQTLITAIKNGSQPYNILADLNLDGAVTQADLNAFSAYSGALGGRNVLTASNGSATTGNDIGYAGYTWNDERSQWHVRHREYDPKLGRWLQRDSVHYVDSMNLYAYVTNSPLTWVDPLGLRKCGPRVWLFTGSWCVDDDVWEAAYDAFAETVNDRLNGYGDAIGLDGLAAYFGGTEYTFDELERLKGKCWAECFARELLALYARYLLEQLPIIPGIDSIRFDPDDFIDPDHDTITPGFQPDYPGIAEDADDILRRMEERIKKGIENKEWKSIPKRQRGRGEDWKRKYEKNLKEVQGLRKGTLRIGKLLKVLAAVGLAKDVWDIINKCEQECQESCKDKL